MLNICNDYRRNFKAGFSKAFQLFGKKETPIDSNTVNQEIK